MVWGRAGKISNPHIKRMNPFFHLPRGFRRGQLREALAGVPDNGVDGGVVPGGVGGIGALGAVHRARSLGKMNVTLLKKNKPI